MSRTKSTEILIETHVFSFAKMSLEMPYKKAATFVSA